jgi:hypothetical protein
MNKDKMKRLIIKDNTKTLRKQKVDIRTKFCNNGLEKKNQYRRMNNETNHIINIKKVHKWPRERTMFQVSSLYRSVDLGPPGVALKQQPFRREPT